MRGDPLGGSLRARIFQLGAREAVGWGVWVWETWLGIRLLRLMVRPLWQPVSHLLWYGYYPCMGMLIFLAVWISYASNRTPEDRALPRWLQGLLLVDLLLAGLALTNDWHQLVFQIQPSTNPHQDIYTYGFVYYLILFSYLAQLLLANGWLCWRAFREGENQSGEAVAALDGHPALRRLHCWLYPADPLAFPE